MQKRITLWLMAAGLLLSTLGIAKAQDTTATQTTTTATTQDQNSSATTAVSPDNATAMPTQDESATTPTQSGANETHSNVRTLTGCLQKGEGTSEYDLTARDGSTWEVRSDAVNLSSYVGQTVTVTGAVAHSTMHGMKEDARKEAQEHGMDKSGTEHGHLTATNVSVVSQSCSR